jgi:hypothetical protein
MKIDLISLQAFIISFGVLLLIVWRARPPRSACATEPQPLRRETGEREVRSSEGPPTPPSPSR